MKYAATEATRTETSMAVIGSVTQGLERSINANGAAAADSE